MKTTEQLIEIIEIAREIYETNRTSFGSDPGVNPVLEAFLEARGILGSIIYISDLEWFGIKEFGTLEIYYL